MTELSRDYLLRQLANVQRVAVLSAIFMVLAVALLVYGLSADRLGFVLLAFAWLLISQFQRYRAARVRRRIEAHLEALEHGGS
jgi:Flp pilus assembly protein TadB